jgi:hypothetical protein
MDPLFGELALSMREDIVDKVIKQVNNPYIID